MKKWLFFCIVTIALVSGALLTLLPRTSTPENPAPPKLTHVVSHEFSDLPKALHKKLHDSGFLQSLDESDWLRAQQIIDNANFAEALREGGTPFSRELLQNLNLVNQLIEDISPDVKQRLYSAYGTLFFYIDEPTIKRYLSALTNPDDRSKAVNSFRLTSVHPKTWTDDGNYTAYKRLAQYFKALEYSNIRFQKGRTATFGFKAKIYHSQGHNHAFFFWVQALLEGYFGSDSKSAFLNGSDKRDVTLVHFDSHGDIQSSFLNSTLSALRELKDFYALNSQQTGGAGLNRFARNIQDIDISDFIIPAFISGIIDKEVIWVVPHLNQAFVDYVHHTYPGKAEIINDSKNNISSIIITVIEYGSPNGMEAMTMKAIELKDLPNLKNRKTILDIDEDFFGTRHPHGRPDLVQFISSDEEYELLMKNTLTAIWKNLRPGVITIAQSPGFTIKGQERKITERLVMEFGH